MAQACAAPESRKQHEQQQQQQMAEACAAEELRKQPEEAQRLDVEAYHRQLELRRLADEALAVEELRLQEEEAQRLELEAYHQQLKQNKHLAANEVRQQQWARREQERQECRELLEQVRQRNEENARRQQQPGVLSTASDHSVVTAAPGGDSGTPSTSPNCVPRAITDDNDTPSSSPLAAILDEVATAPGKDPFLFGLKSGGDDDDDEACVSPRRRTTRSKPTKVMAANKLKSKELKKRTGAFKSNAIAEDQVPQTPEKAATFGTAEGPMPGTGSSRKRRNDQVSTCKQPSVLLSRPKQYDFQPTPKKLKEGDSASGAQSKQGSRGKEEEADQTTNANDSPLATSKIPASPESL
jgi:hypothetical protein